MRLYCSIFNLYKIGATALPRSGGMYLEAWAGGVARHTDTYRDLVGGASRPEREVGPGRSAGRQIEVSSRF